MQILRDLSSASDERGIALTIGNFDGLHRGHQAMLRRLLARAAELDLPAAVMTFEPHPREFFAPAAAPARLSSLREKVGLFSEAGIDRCYVCRFDRHLATLNAEAFVNDVLRDKLHVKWVLIGDDFRFGAQRRGDFALLHELSRGTDLEVEAMSSVMRAGARVSSTAVRMALQESDFTRARDLLGRDYAISGRVVHGEKTGRKLGFPTANIALKHHKPPLAGIFAVELFGLQTPYFGVASLGTRPTIRPGGRPTLEVHLFDFDRDIYGAHVSVAFLHKLRDEQRYPDLEILRAQIKRDVADARAWIAAQQRRANICLPNLNDVE